MTLLEALTQLAKRFVGKTVNDEFKKLATPFLNDAYREVGKSWNWKELDTYGSVVAIPVVEGTVTITAGSFTVSIAGASTDWKGRFFRKQGGENDYRIVYVDGTNIYFDQALIESGSIDYEIEKRFYTLPTEVRVITGFENRPYLTSLDNNAMRQHLPNYNSVVIDNPFTVHGADKFTDDYKVGNISVAQSDPYIVTGTGGMEWLKYVRAGNIMRFNNVDYRVRRVEKNDRLVLYNGAPKTDNVSYVVKQDSAKTIRMRGKFTTDKVIPFQYIRSVYDLIHDDDLIELSEEARLAVVDFADAGISAGPIKQDDWAARLLRAQARLERAQSLSNPTRPAYRMFAPLIPKGYGRG